jgi:pimeloyl-ACP methyl ester carboxylesterase
MCRETKCPPKTASSTRSRSVSRRRSSPSCAGAWQNKADFFDVKPITIPYAISVFPDELYQAPRNWAERAYPGNLVYFNEVDRGGHFAAWEQPDLFSAEMRAAFRTLR